MSSFCICEPYSHFFRKNTCELDIVLTRTVNTLTNNELVKLRRFEQLGPEFHVELDYKLRRIIGNTDFRYSSNILMLVTSMIMHLIMLDALTFLIARRCVGPQIE